MAINNILSSIINMQVDFSRSSLPFQTLRLAMFIQKCVNTKYTLLTHDKNNVLFPASHTDKDIQELIDVAGIQNYMSGKDVVKFLKEVHIKDNTLGKLSKALSGGKKTLLEIVAASRAFFKYLGVSDDVVDDIGELLLDTRDVILSGGQTLSKITGKTLLNIILKLHALFKHKIATFLKPIFNIIG